MRATGGLAAIAAVMSAAAAVPAAAGPAATRIDAYDQAVIGVMRANLPLKARADRFAAVVQSYYDVGGIAQAVAGPAWAQAPAADRAALTAALARHSAVSLAQNFKSYDGTPFVADPAERPRAGGSVVKVTIGRDILYFQLRQAGGAWKIVDVISGGVSQLAVQRSELAGTIAAGGLAAAARRLGEADAKVLAKG